MLAQQRQLDVLEVGGLQSPHRDELRRRLALDPVGQLVVQPEVAAEHLQLRPDLLAPLGQYHEDLACPLSGNNHRALVYDPGLLERDLLPRVAELADVVQLDVGDDRDLRVHDVGGVPPPAHARLQHGDVDALAAEVVIGQRRHQLEVGQLLAGPLLGLQIAEGGTNEDTEGAGRLSHFLFLLTVFQKQLDGLL